MSSQKRPVVDTERHEVDPPRSSETVWTETLELGYTTASSEQKESTLAKNNLSPVCFQCGKPVAILSRCAKCHVASYCSRECQVKDWKQMPNGHKAACKTLKRVGINMTLNNQEDKGAARQEIFDRIRFYACPYAVYRSTTLGRGFLFVQSPSTLAEMSVALPINSFGHPLGTRSVLLHFLTIGEYDSEVCRDDFELAVVRNSLKELVETYDVEKSLVLLMRFRCGHVAVGKARLSPEYGLCKSLGHEYYGSMEGGALQLNLDDI